MTEALLFIMLALQAILVVIGVILLSRKPAQPTDHTQDLASLKSRLENVFEAHDRLEREITGEIDRLRAESTQTASNLRTELSTTLSTNAAAINQALTAAGAHQQAQTSTALTGINTAVSERLSDFTKGLTKLADSSATSSTHLRSEIELKLNAHATKLTEINSAITAHLDKLRTRVEDRLSMIQQSNDQKLEQMRATVDEKLQSTLEKRLGESFKQVADRLDGVQKGFGEMQALAGNVTDLRRVMTNVKTRGTWGEVQLCNLLEQLFASTQYVANFKPKRSGEMVEFALRLPGGASGGSDEPIYLPIDSKFPVEDFQRLSAAAEVGDPVAVAAARKALENRIYQCAADIKNKYINVPVTTDFAILFLPTESLHAEVLRIDGLCECLQRDYRVTITGPTTFAAFATALLVGFQTLKIQKSTAAVGKLLGQVRTDFSKFADLLESVEDKLDSAKRTVGDARHRSDMIVTRLARADGLEPAPSPALNGQIEPSLLPAPTDD
ncbi:MAG TPA: DNA recombination protein RmuC [Phycisphaerales bacterium]|nr:DNA recombination protein RmuC [Phycisphaerales bacterium]